MLALPASDVYMQARADVCDKRRGVAPVDKLRSMGVTAAFATNNVQNLFTFTGDGDVLKVGTLTAQMLHLGAQAQHADLLHMATSTAAEAIGCRDHALVVGSRGDLVVLHGCTSPTDVLAAPPVARTVLKRGRVVAQTTKTVKLFPPSSPSSSVSSFVRERPWPLPVVAAAALWLSVMAWFRLQRQRR